MHSKVSCLVLAALLGCALAQYGGSYDRGYDRGYDHGQQQQGGYNSQQYVGPKVQILNHKQALGTDGSFNYAFNADNGIQQGESINPDGSRQGGYSYVDPSGKTISLKYIAGRDGFRVIEGDHIPRAVPLPPQHAAAYQAAAAAQADVAHRPAAPVVPYRQPYNVAETGDDHGNYQNYRSNGADDGSYRSSGDDGSYRSTGDDGSYRSGAYSAASEIPHSGPHSFGNGFAFEFQGGKY